MSDDVLSFPENLARLKELEDQLHKASLQIISGDKNLLLHVDVVEATMDLANCCRMIENSDEDFKVVQMASLRLFNGCSCALKLMMSGYYQASAMLMRDMLEVVFLLDLFSTDKSLINAWRLADKQTRMREFKPVKVREKLDERDGFSTRKRAELYELLSELASHITMKSTAMLRPPGGDALMGPFMDETALVASLEELAKLAVQAGENMNVLIMQNFKEVFPSQVTCHAAKKRWMAAFYGR